jgi:hypothetical protein
MPRSQEEALLCSVVAMAITALLFNLTEESLRDVTYACFFLICASPCLGVRCVYLGTAPYRVLLMCRMQNIPMA